MSPEKRRTPVREARLLPGKVFSWLPIQKNINVFTSRFKNEDSRRKDDKLYLEKKYQEFSFLLHAFTW
jgi:hypothetical protein